ncbi:MAG: acetoin utilization protein AcuC [Alphaproteobacteria bacterium]|nr:acetoin utilization protein AcuC [Alphaproteobacteria bacterium]
MSQGMLDRPHLIGSEIYRHSVYGKRHPLSIARVSSTLDMIRALGWFDEAAYIDSPLATFEQLTTFHAPDYVEAVMAAERNGEVTDADRERYNIGRNGNPVFPEIFRRPATSVGATLLAVELLTRGGIVHNPAGGTHHGLKDRASGFCYFNDPAIGILAMQDRGWRAAYVDLDAHHGDGVELAFHDDPDVLTVSVHEADRWPYTGAVTDRAGGMARNIPVPKGLNDSEHALILAQAVIPLVSDFAPDALVIQCGCDGLDYDPQSKLSLSNRAIWDAVGRLLPLAPRVLVLGGGGYNPWGVARCWSGIWGVLNGHEVPAFLPDGAERVLRDLTWNHSRGKNPPDFWFTTLADRPNPGPVRPEIHDLIREVLRP